MTFLSPKTRGIPFLLQSSSFRQSQHGIVIGLQGLKACVRADCVKTWCLGTYCLFPHLIYRVMKRLDIHCDSFHLDAKKERSESMMEDCRCQASLLLQRIQEFLGKPEATVPQLPSKRLETRSPLLLSSPTPPVALFLAIAFKSCVY